MRMVLSPAQGEVIFRSRLAGRITWLYFPAFLIAAAMGLPLLYLGLRALSAGPAIWEWLGRVQSLQLLLRSLGLALAVTLSAAALAVPLAWLVTRSDLIGRRIWAAVLPLPLVIPSYVGAYLYVSLLSPHGLIPTLLTPWVSRSAWPSIYGLGGAWLVLTLMTYPYVYLNARAVLAMSDRTVEEAARSLGYSPWATFWRITLPLLRPALASGGLLVALYVLRDFGAVAILRYTTFTRAIYLHYQSSLDRSTAALLALVLVVVTVLLLVIQQRLARLNPAAAVHAPKPPPPVALGLWQVPALALVLLVVGLGVGVPVGGLIYWLGRGIRAGETLGAVSAPLLNSILAAGLAALVTVVAALPLAVLAVRHGGRVSRALVGWSYLGFAVPGVVIALALVFFGANFTPALYQTLVMLVFAYVVLFLPQALGVLQAALRLVRRNLEEAAASLGHSPGEVFRRVTLPLISPGLASAAGLVFLTALKELPATLLLAPAGFPTLATRVWGAVSEAFFARAAWPALILIGVSALSMLWFNRNPMTRNEPNP